MAVVCMEVARIKVPGLTSFPVEQRPAGNISIARDYTLPIHWRLADPMEAALVEQETLQLHLAQLGLDFLAVHFAAERDQVW